MDDTIMGIFTVYFLFSYFQNCYSLASTGFIMENCLLLIQYFKILVGSWNKIVTLYKHSCTNITFLSGISFKHFQSDSILLFQWFIQLSNKYLKSTYCVSGTMICSGNAKPDILISEFLPPKLWGTSVILN